MTNFEFKIYKIFVPLVPLKPSWVNLCDLSSSLNLSGKVPLKSYRDVCKFLPTEVKIIKGLCFALMVSPVS